MNGRALLCCRHNTRTEGLRQIRSSRKYDVLKVIGSIDYVDLSHYSEIVLLYQGNIDVADATFIDFVKKNRSHLKGATILFDIPMEVIEDTGIERSIDCMRSISKEAFEEDIPLYIHSNHNMPVQADRFSEFGIGCDNNAHWVKESGHAAILAQYYLNEAYSIPHHSLPFMAIGILLIIVGAILSILSYFKITPGEVAIYNLIIIMGISTVSLAYLAIIRNHWKK